MLLRVPPLSERTQGVLDQLVANRQGCCLCSHVAQRHKHELVGAFEVHEGHLHANLVLVVDEANVAHDSC